MGFFSILCSTNLLHKLKNLQRKLKVVTLHFLVVVSTLFQIDFERDVDGNRMPPLGAGAFGCVYKATEGCRKLAIKVINTWNDEFLREIRNHSTFRHKNIIQFRGWRPGEGGTIEIIMDRVEGGTLTSQVYILLQMQRIMEMS